MLTITISGNELYDSTNNEFIYIPETTLKLEHSLVSVSKWECMYKRPFLSDKTGPKTSKEILDYIQCMSIEEVDPLVIQSLTYDQQKRIIEYIDDKCTATTFKKNRHGRSTNSYTTSEIIYWEMITLGIPIECENWNLNRLLTLIRVCDEKGQPPKKMSQDALLRQYAGVNAKRRKH